MTCRFCLSNNLLTGEIVAENQRAFAIPASTATENFLIIPKGHYKTLEDLPDDWWADLKQLLVQLAVPRDNYNLSINIGEQAGQKVAHLHFRIIPRQAETPASAKGLAALIAEVNGAD
jgi:diadenosine tetraphosphate (Ap4A) HIT family hydrolase